VKPENKNTSKVKILIKETKFKIHSHISSHFMSFNPGFYLILVREEN
jgi:hypothetical protein